jgi:16S rRNA processing protein RimM
LTDAERPLPAGRVGRPHGLNGAFYVEDPAHEFAEGTEVTIGDRHAPVRRRAGPDARPLIEVEGIDDRSAAEALRGQQLLVPGGREDLGPDQWYDDDLIGCRIEGLGDVRAVLHGPSCDVLEVGEKGVLVPLIHDAVKRVDIEARAIEVDRAFLGLDDGA